VAHSHSHSHFPDDRDILPEGSVVEGHIVKTDLNDTADYVVIGSGAAGATAAMVLSGAGYSVIILEEGPWVRTREFEEDVYPSLKKLFRDVATNVTMGKVLIPVMQGRCVGGGTTINSAIAWRPPERVIDNWDTEYGLGDTIRYKDLHDHFEELDRALVVRPVNENLLGNNSSAFREAASKLGIKAEVIKRYDGGCLASASCITGCRSAKKLSVNVSYIPTALQQGAKIYTSTRALRVDSKYGRVTDVHANFDSPTLATLKIKVRRGVIVAASAVQTPGILRRSGIRLAAVGKHFQAHPGTSLVARFNRPVSMNKGATQGLNSTQFIEQERFKIESLALPPELFALRLPSIGPTFMKNFMDYQHMLNWALVVRGEARGQIRSVFGQEKVQYTPTPKDVHSMRTGLRLLSEMMFAAGATEVYPYVHGMPTLKSADDLKHWDRASLNPKNYGMMMSHLFGSARIGPDERSSVVGLDFQVHGTRGLYVLDSSIFPTNLGVNPQHTIMAVARLGATRIAATPLPAN
jgi:choline dehydrogenase-like flavoprotein